MKKRIASIITLVFILLTMVALAMPSNAAEETFGDFKYELKDKKVTITGITRVTDSELVIPNKIKGYPVTKIGYRAFAGRDTLKSIVLPDSVTVIGSYAFEKCSALESIVIPDNVTEIGEYAFLNCTGLAEVRVTSVSLETFGRNAFWDCKSLKSVYIDSSAVVRTVPSQEKNGDLTFYANAIMIEESITDIPSRIVKNYPHTKEVTYNHKQYVAYVAHDFSGDWVSDGSGHWHDCSECDAIGDKEMHSFDFPCGTTCDICGYVRTVTHNFSKSWYTDETSHWRQCDCDLISDEGPHTWDEGVVTKAPTKYKIGERKYTCTGCGKIRTEEMDKIPGTPRNEPIDDVKLVAGITLRVLSVVALITLAVITVCLIVAAVIIVVMVKKKKNKRGRPLD